MESVDKNIKKEKSVLENNKQEEIRPAQVDSEQSEIPLVQNDDSSEDSSSDTEDEQN